jgi:DUF4097 and DUF4098 domain-containing protein YvlB
MKIALGACIVLVFGASAAYAESYDITERFSAADIREIEVRERGGPSGIVIRANVRRTFRLVESNTSNIEVRVTGEVESNRRRCLPEITIEPSGQELEVGVKRCSGPAAFLRLTGELDVAVGVPAGWNGSYTADTSSGDHFVAASNLRTVRLESSSGDIEIDRLSAAEIEIEVSSGDVRADRVAGTQVEIDSSRGDVTVGDASGPFDVELSSGDLDIDFAGNPGSLEARASSGRLEILGLRGDVVAETSSGSIELTLLALESEVTLRASSGDIDVRLPEGTGAELRLETSSGAIDLDFPVTTEGRIDEDELIGRLGEGGPELRAETSSGDIRLIRG